MKETNKTPDSVACIPVATMPKAHLQKLQKLAQRMLDGCRELRTGTPELIGVYEYARALWNRAYAELGRRELLAAERADKGRICWEQFSPRNRKPLDISLFDLQRHVVRTPNRKIEHNKYWTITAEWELQRTDPWEDFAKAQQPVDLVAFAQYAADVDECWRRHKARLCRDAATEVAA